jgi:hypothetical protein
MAELPRLLYLADVPVESSQHGSALMFRALEGYPADRLLIVETALPSQPERRLPGVRYAAASIANRRWLNSRAHGLYSAWVTRSAPARVDRVRAVMADFQPEAVVTVGHGFGWLTAAALATELGVPLHLVVHDDWPRLAAIAGPMRAWLDRRFGDVYRLARTRLMVSPFMAEVYERRYGAAASVMYPSRSSDCPVFEPGRARAIAATGEIVIGYGGNSGPEMMSCLRELAEALPGAGARLSVFGPFGEGARAELLSRSPAITFHGMVPYRQMIGGLRDTADVLFVPMTFEAADRDNMVVSFPSKLADYTAAALPLLIYAPPYSSAARWARAHDAAEIVEERGRGPLQQALADLRSDPARRDRLAGRAREVGDRCFDAAAARQTFYTALGTGHA